MSEETGWDRFMRGIGVTVSGALMIALVVLVFTLPTMWCWNYVIANKFGAPELGFWETFCLVFVVKMIVPYSKTECK